MGIFHLFKKNESPRAPQVAQDRGLLVFENTGEVIQVETLLKREGWEIRVMGPPPELRTGCDLVIDFPLIEELNICRCLEAAGLPPLQVVPVTSPLLHPVDLFQSKDFGQHLMVRAANMKITIDKSSLVIVNISGGGCPDVPYLAGLLVGTTLSSAPRPRDIGHTLCGYALQLAYEEILRQCSQ